MEHEQSIVIIGIFALGQALASIIWLTRLGSRVDAIERDRERAIRENDQQHFQLSERMTNLDEHGSRAMQIMIDRAAHNARRLDRIEQQIWNGRRMPSLPEE